MRHVKTGLHTFMAFPAFLLFALFFLWPLAQGIGMSLTDWDGIRSPSFVGLQNFFSFFKDRRALGDIKTTLLFTLGSAPLLNLVGLGYALLMDGEFHGKGLARVIIYLPAIISPLIMGYIWYFLLQPDRGFVSQAMMQWGFSRGLGDWMNEYWLEMLVLILVNVWQYAGMTMVIYLAGLQGIPQELYESAKMDGAGYWSRLKYVTLPLLIPSIRINVVTNIIGSLSVFDIIMSLTDGGPGYATESLGIYIMRMCYGSKTGYSTAVAMIMFFIILVPVVISMRLTQERE
jgi:raffinose/stachyose/melibiose transport system permease protein